MRYMRHSVGLASVVLLASSAHGESSITCADALEWDELLRVTYFNGAFAGAYGWALSLSSTVEEPGADLDIANLTTIAAIVSDHGDRTLIRRSPQQLANETLAICARKKGLPLNFAIGHAFNRMSSEQPFPGGDPAFEDLKNEPAKKIPETDRAE